MGNWTPYAAVSSFVCVWPLMHTSFWARSSLPQPLRLPVYPSFLADDARWLDGSGGAASVRAAALRSADGAGLARGSEWCPGSTLGERQGHNRAGMLPAPDTQNNAVPAARGGAASLSQLAAPQVPHDSPGADALLAAADKAVEALTPAEIAAAAASPPVTYAHEASSSAGQERMRGTRRGAQPWRVEVTEEGLLAGCQPPAPSAGSAQLLTAVLHAGHELSEAEMVQLFTARGADFQVSYLFRRPPRSSHRACPIHQLLLCRGSRWHTHISKHVNRGMIRMLTVA